MEPSDDVDEARHAGRKVSVYFDGDGTLWDFQAVMRRAMTRTIAELGRLAPDLTGDMTVEAFVADRDAAARELPCEVDHERLRAAGFERSLRRLRVTTPGLATHLTAYFLKHRFADIALYPDVVPCLERLRASGFRVGLLSNGNTDPARFGLGHLFDAVIFAHDVGAPKPDPRMYRVAQQALPAECHVMVGDALIDDVSAPLDHGWLGVWLNRNGLAVPSDVEPTFVLSTLDGLLPLLEREVGAPN